MATSKAQIRIERVCSFEEARQSVFNEAGSLRQRPQSETVPILNSLGRTLAEDIIADRDFPPFARATRDGYAVRAEDTQAIPTELRIMGKVRAGGELPSGFSQLEQGQAVSIMTGAPVPPGSDAVIMLEHTRGNADAVLLLKSVTSGENIVPRASEAPAGTIVLSPGTRISHPEIALAAAVGKSKFGVYCRPRIAILSTGDEVVPIESVPAQNQIRNSNSFSLAAQVIATGGEPIQLPIAPDESSRLRELIAAGLESDLLLLSGGVSAGEYDLVEDVLSQFSAEFFFTGVKIQPGKPLVFGRARPHSSPLRWTYFFGLPGNPISTMVTFELFASILVRALSGDTTSDRIIGAKARLRRELRTKVGLTRFLPAKISGSWEDASVEAVKWQGSGDLAAFAKADCLLVIPPDREEFTPGEWVTIIPLHN